LGVWKKPFSESRLSFPMYLVFFTGHIGKDEPFLLKYNAAEEPN